MKKIAGTLAIVLSALFATRADRFVIWQNHPDALYRCGEEAALRVTVLDDAGEVRRTGEARWTLDNFGTVKLGEGKIDLAKENPFFVRGTLSTPDFLRLRVHSSTNTRVWSVGYDVEKIRQPAPAPADFDAYWQGEKARLAREVPLDPKCEFLRHEAGRDVYAISFATFNNRRIYGFLNVPRPASRTYRVRIRVCDAGSGAIGPWDNAPDEVAATFNVHAFKPAADAAAQRALMVEQNRALGEKWHLPTNRYNTAYAGFGGARGDAFYHDAMLGIARAVDWVVARPEADPTRVTYVGSSQGGGFGLFVVYLNGRFTRAVFQVPAVTGHFGHLANRRSGWPQLFDNLAGADRAATEANAPYYDGVNFAARITTPCRFIVGFSDETCPPANVYSAYNVCPAKDKAILNGIGCTHCRTDGWIGWLRARVTKNPLYDWDNWVRTPNAKRTRVQLWFDTEDYVNPASWDAAREIAKIMTEEGVCGHFNVAGLYAKALLDNRRFDVIDALKKHAIGTQSYSHSWHPNVTELGDLADYDEAYRRVLKEEAEGYGLLRAAFGLDRLLFSCYPGNGSSYVAFDVHSDLGATFHGGAGAVFGRCPRGDAMWYQNMRHVLYNGTMSLQDLGLSGDLSDAEIGRRLDQAAAKEAVVFYMHPCMAPCRQFWDGVNLNRGNWAEFGVWTPCEKRAPAEVQAFYARFRAFLRRVKDDPRFEFTDCAKLLAQQKARAAITRADVPAIRAALLKELGPVDAPASWCVADCFQAAVKFLCGEDRHVPGKVYGFLERPVGVKTPVKVKADDLRAAARKIVFKRHLATAYDVGGVRLGPADFLYAALEVLETGAAEVTVTPREDQVGPLAKHVPSMATFSHRNTWLYVPEFEDRYLSERLRLQYWTLRYE